MKNSIRWIVVAFAVTVVFSGCQQNAGEAFAPDELTLSFARGVVEEERFMGVTMPEMNENFYGVSLTWHIK